ncbi:MAG: Gfo/Idh/MocA family oxidoreductase [Pseudomonadota bacterium]
MAEKIYRFGIVGAGMIAEFHALAIAAMDNAELVAVFARRPEAAEKFAAEQACAGYTDFEAFLAHDGLDIVTICSPSGAHLEPVITAARAGKHIICEKPLEVTTERVDEMIAACETSGVMLAGIFPRRFNQATNLLKSAIDSDRFGTIVTADASIKWWRDQAYYDSGAWRGTWALDGGGALMNQSIHTIDLLLHLMGDVRHVRAQTRLAAHTGIEVEDVGVAMLEFENGAFGTIHGSTACWSAEGHAAEIQICGSAGSVFMADDKFRVWEFKDEHPDDQTILLDYGLNADVAGAGAADPKAIDFTWHQRNFEDALAALNGGHAPLVDGREGRRAVALIRAIYESAERGGEQVAVA